MGYDHSLMKNAPPTQYGTVTEEQRWEDMEYSLKKVVPVAEKAEAKLAVHLDDPLVSPIRDVARILITPGALQRVIDLVPSPNNGITFCQGTVSSMNADLPTGMLLAGNCRDTQYVLKMPDFPLYSFGTRSNAFGGWIITEVNQSVYLPGHMTHYVKVMPGDWIFGDNDGVQLIPAHLVDEVLFRIEHTFEIENAEREQIAAGMPIDEVYRVFGVL